ncbi:MAG TPA: endonuclease domain-containing protein [Polyangiaceae bacterium]|nr:endonuclease domain-containing protein [Polyangiaceae bacterium]
MLPHDGSSLPLLPHDGISVLSPSHDGTSSFRTSRARALRARHTASEARLWHMLRRNRQGAHFRRQHPVGPFYVDFICLTRGLVIEIDGAVHDDPDVAFADARRQEALEALGLRVLRFSAGEVERDLGGVLWRIRAALR